MATGTLQAESPAAKQLTELEILYAAWRRANAAWELDRYAPEHIGNDLPDDLNDRHCDATCDALNAYLLHPVENVSELARKLRVIRDEQIAEGWTKASLIIEQLTQDAHAIVLSGGRA